MPDVDETQVTINRIGSQHLPVQRLSPGSSEAEGLRVIGAPKVPWAGVAPLDAAENGRL